MLHTQGIPPRLFATQQSAWPHPHIRGFSHDRVQLDQKKGAQLPPLGTTLLAPNPDDPASTTLELDELWSFVLKKTNDSWIWIALCRQTRQVVAYAVGDRSKKTGQRLWEAIPEGYRQGHCFTETGETAHVERWNNTLRQRLARFVRMTLSFSKSVLMHKACLLLFLHRYNTERAILLK